MRRVSFLLLALVVAAGCGGGGSTRLTRDQYAAKADAICGKYSEQLKGLRATTLAELVTAVDKAIPVLDNALTELRKLKPPTDEQATSTQWLAEVETLKADVRKIRDKATRNDLAGVAAAAHTAGQDNDKSNQLARQLGMKVCSKG